MFRILLIEDDALLQRMLQDLLKREGFETLTAGDGRTGTAKAAALKPDLVLLDVNLPDQDGFFVCTALKADPATRRIPVVMLTAEAQSLASRVKGLELGADDYLFKPISPAVLVSRIKSLLKSSTPRP